MADYEPSLQQLLANQSPRQYNGTARNPSGWAAVGAGLGRAFAGPGDDMSNAFFQEGAYKGAQTAKVLQEARDAQERSVRRDADITKARADGNEQLAQMMELAKDSNFGEMGQGFLDNQKYRNIDTAMANRPAGVTAGNWNLAGAEGKPLAIVKDENGTLINPYGMMPNVPASNAGTPHSDTRFVFAPGTPQSVIDATHAEAQADGNEDAPSLQAGMGLPQGRQKDPSEIGSMMVTPVGQSTIGANNARATDSYAAGNEHNVRSTTLIPAQTADANAHAAAAGKGGSAIPFTDKVALAQLTTSRQARHQALASGDPKDYEAINAKYDSLDQGIIQQHDHPNAPPNVAGKIPALGMMSELLSAFTGGGAPSTVTGAAQIPPAAINYLRVNPNQAGAFTKKYKVPAAQFLGK